MRCGGADLGGCQCSDGLSGGYGAAACPAAGLESAGSAQWCFNEAPLVAPADRRSATPRTRRMAGRGQAAAIRPQNPRRTSAAPCPRYTPRPRALAAAEGQLEGARAQLVHADHVSKGHRQALSIHLAWACTARSVHVSALERGRSSAQMIWRAGGDQSRRAPAGQSSSRSWRVGQPRRPLTAPPAPWSPALPLNDLCTQRAGARRQPGRLGRLRARRRPRSRPGRVCTHLRNAELPQNLRRSWGTARLGSPRSRL